MRPGCVSLNLVLDVSCYDVHFIHIIITKSLTKWTQLGSGGLSILSNSLMVSYRSLKKGNLESWGRNDFGLRSSSSAREKNSSVHKAPALTK